MGLDGLRGFSLVQYRKRERIGLTGQRDLSSHCYLCLMALGYSRFLGHTSPALENTCVKGFVWL